MKSNLVLILFTALFQERAFNVFALLLGLCLQSSIADCDFVSVISSYSDLLSLFQQPHQRYMSFMNDGVSRIALLWFVNTAVEVELFSPAQRPPGCGSVRGARQPVRTSATFTFILERAVSALLFASLFGLFVSRLARSKIWIWKYRKRTRSLQVQTPPHTHV